MDKVKSFIKSIMLIIFYYLIFGLMYSILHEHIYSSNNVISNLSIIFANIVVLYIYILIFRKSIIPDWDDFKKNYKTYLIKCVKYWLIGLLIMYISNILISIFANVSSSNQDLNVESLKNMPISSIFEMVIVAPIIEELITRKSFREVFDNEYIYIIMCGLIFGGLHILVAESLIECLYIIPFGALGCAFAKMYYKTNNIWTNITFHAIHNAITIFLILL